MNPEKIKKILNRYRQGKCTEEERALLEEWYLHYLEHHAGPAPDEQELKEKVDEIQKALPVKFRWRKIKRIMAAAAALLIVGGTSLYIFSQRNILPSLVNPHSNPVISQSTPSGVYIMLEDGQKVSVGEQVSGNVLEKDNIRVRKSDTRKMVYENLQDRSSAGAALVYNTVVIPKGTQYELELADGTKVWLNAHSSLRFPTRFSDTARVVDITGEAYFEVTKDASRPFRVRSGDQTIEVLGTRFNVQAYTDEPLIKTTLLEGSVRISLQEQGAEKITQVLKPGEQASLVKAENQLSVDAVDARSAIHWKEGVVIFKNADLATILRQVSRWYDVEIEYVGQVPKRHFTGGISMSAPLSDFLKILKLNHIQFEKKADRIIIGIPPVKGI